MHFKLWTVICLCCSWHSLFVPTINQLTSPEDFASSYLLSKCWLYLYLLEWQWAAAALDVTLSSTDCSLSAFSML